MVTTLSGPLRRWSGIQCKSFGRKTALRRQAPFLVLAAALISMGMTVLAVHAADREQEAGNHGPDAAEHYEKALIASNLGELRTAYVHLKNALDVDPFLLSARLLLGKVFLGLGYGERAVKELLLAESLGAHRSLIQIPLARAYLLQGEAQRVIAELVPTGNLATEDAELLALRGQAYLEQGEYFDAQRSFARAWERNPRSVAAIIGRTQVMLRQGDLSAANDLAQAAVEAGPSDPRAWYLKGILANILGDATAALENFSKSAEILPAHLPTQVARIGLLMKIERLDEAFERCPPGKRAARGG